MFMFSRRLLFWPVKILTFFFKTLFQDACFLGCQDTLLFFSRRSFKTLVFWAVKTLVMFSRYLIKTFDLVFKTLFVYLENSPKRLENRSCFLEVSSFYFDYVLKGILIGYLDRVS